MTQHAQESPGDPSPLTASSEAYGLSLASEHLTLDNVLLTGCTCTPIPIQPAAHACASESASHTFSSTLASVPLGTRNLAHNDPVMACQESTLPHDPGVGQFMRADGCEQLDAIRVLLAGGCHCKQSLALRLTPSDIVQVPIGRILRSDQQRFALNTGIIYFKGTSKVQLLSGHGELSSRRELWICSSKFDGFWIPTSCSLILPD